MQIENKLQMDIKYMHLWSGANQLKIVFTDWMTEPLHFVFL